MYRIIYRDTNYFEVEQAYSKACELYGMWNVNMIQDVCPNGLRYWVIVLDTTDFPAVRDIDFC